MPPDTRFARLVAPHTPAAFLADCWDKRAVVTGSAEATTPLLAFDRLALKRAAFRAPPGALAASYNEGGRVISAAIGADQLEFCHGAGMTINLRQAHLFDPGLAEVVTTLRRELGYCSNVEAYVFWSPPGGGLGLHFDDSGAFVIPTEGAKEWRYGATPALPFPPAPVLLADAADMALLYPWCSLEGPRPDELCRTVLRPGNALYLPAGTWHTASAVDPNGTLAVTLSFSPRPLHRSLAGLLGGRLMPRTRWRGTPAPSQGDGPEAQASRLAPLREAFRELKELVASLTFEEFAAACDPGSLAPALEDHAPGAEPDAPTASLTKDDWLAPTDLIRFAPGDDDDGEPCFVITSGKQSATIGIEALSFIEGLCQTARPFRAGAAVAWVGETGRDAWAEVRPVLEGLLERGILSKVEGTAGREALARAARLAQ